MQNEISEYKFYLNMNQRKFILYNSDTSIAFRDGNLGHKYDGESEKYGIYSRN